MDELTLLPEEEAAQVHFDTRNCRVFFRLLLLFTLWNVVEAAHLAAEEGLTGQLARPVVMLIVIRVLYALRERSALAQHFRSILLAYLVLQTILLKGFDPQQSFHYVDFVIPPVLIFFRLPASLLAVPLAAVWTLSAGRDVLMATFSESPFHLWAIFGQTALSLGVFSAADRLSQKSYHEFLDVWRREHRLQRERTRMRGELDDARRIQLSMLPRGDPKIPWLDLAGLSIPASEVGGDYYEYFELSPSQQILVVADVAGHGVASGLLLSGIRSCLYLLQETPLEPVETLVKLDRMVRLTSGKRMFVTMLYAVFDRDRKQLTFSSAGHPPLVCYRAAERQVQELALHALPLGTGLAATYEQKTVPFDHDDVFLFSTDGIAETINSRGDLYGNDRLSDRLRDIAADRSAKEIRDTLLGDVWTFKADGKQTDDITIVVVRVR